MFFKRLLTGQRPLRHHLLTSHHCHHHHHRSFSTRPSIVHQQQQQQQQPQQGHCLFVESHHQEQVQQQVQQQEELPPHILVPPGSEGTRHTVAVKRFIDLDTMRMIPKAELHRHLDGSLRLETILDLANRQNLNFGVKTVDELRALIVVPEHCQSLVEYLKAFQYTIAVSQTEYALTRVMYEVCEDAMLDGVNYIEVRFAPNLHSEQGLVPTKVLESVILGARLAQENFAGFHARIIVCGIRTHDVNIVSDMARVAVQYRNEGVVAFDIAGPELGYVPSKFRDAFTIVHDELMSSTIHAGEAADHMYVHEALHVCRATRIGHGVNLKDDPSLMQFVLERQIPLEMCLTSNLQTKAVHHYSEHPLPDFFRRGMMVVPCTDNTLMSDITLSREYVKIQELFMFDQADVLKLVDNSFRAAFVHDDLKNELRRRARQVASGLGLSVQSVDGADDSGITTIPTHIE